MAGRNGAGLVEAWARLVFGNRRFSMNGNELFAGVRVEDVVSVKRTGV